MLLFTCYSLSSTDYTKGPRCPRRDRHATGSPTASRLPRTRTPEAPKDAGAAPLTSVFVGMASYAPTYFLDLMDDDVESDGSSISDVAPSHRPSWECTMVDALG